MGMRQNYLFPWGGEIPCSENIEPSYLQIFDNKYFVYEQFRMLYRFSGPSDCWKIPFPRFLPTRNFPVLRNFSGFMDFASKYSGFEWQGVFRLADRSRIGRTTAEQGVARMRTDLKTVAGDRMYPPPRQICRMRLLRLHADIRAPAIGEGDAVAAQWQMKNRSWLIIGCDFISVCPGQGLICENRYK